MAICPECDEPVVIDEDEVEEGDIVSCEECGSVLKVVSVTPLEFDAVDDEDDEDDDEDEDFDDEEDGDADGDDEEEEEKTEDWDE
ncbi:MAG: hypothetical protein JNM38_14925 [Acidobacteria bacterium]|jgi:alpha-aminoadipate carrier protein LysW|nr:hypothetical protein [Acidobacteriota bacterium]